LRKQRQLPSVDLLEDNMGDGTKLDTDKELVTLAEATRLVAELRMANKDWSGMPLPVPGLDLVIEPRYRHQKITEFRWQDCFEEDGTRIPLNEEAVAQSPSAYRLVNSWWSDRLRTKIMVYQDKHGHARVGAETENTLWFALRTMEAAVAWPLQAEEKAQKKLASLIPAHLFEIYMLTGHYNEVSERSGLTYIFRRGRPTVAMREMGEAFHILCALCLHPIGYYAQTWAGVMCPTDEVIAHLLMMRGSEEKYWANANQHSIDHPAAGV
jgi:hypothetical protein